MRKNFLKKLCVAAMAVVMTVGSAMSAMAADEYTAEFGAQFNKDINETVGEWPSFSDAKVTFTEGVEATFTYTFDSNVKFAGNYVAINTNYPYSEGVSANVTSIKVDGVAVEMGDAYLNNEGTDDGLRLTLTNLWNSDIVTQPMDASAVPEFKTIEIKFIVGEPETTTAEETTPAETTTASGAGAGETTTAATGTGTPSTGDTAMVGLFVALAAVSAVVVLKKRTVTE